MSEVVINGIQLSLAGPGVLPLSVVLRDSPAYDGPRNFFTVSMKNESGHVKTLPFDELSRNIVLVYRNPATGDEIIDNKTPPPKLDGAVEKLGPGATMEFQVVFAFPDTIAVLEEGKAALQFCVKWEDSWLRSTAYSPESFDWNESFELCREIQIVEE